FQTTVTFNKYYLPFLILFSQKHRTTLFPYTTLFRSRSGLEKGRIIESVRVGTSEDGISAKKVVSVGTGVQEHQVATLTTFLAEIDRKSTRLNSSHRTISYAVFCLKKKNKKI